MQEPRNETNYFFADESGDTTFYNKKKNLLLGRKAVLKFL